jgi:predicted amidohydrolase
VGEQKILSIEEIIRKMTSLGADHVGIKDRGVTKVGNHADLVLFDLDSITDNATIERPDQLADGIIGVWVNGKRDCQNGQLHEALELVDQTSDCVLDSFYPHRGLRVSVNINRICDTRRVDNCGD